LFKKPISIKPKPYQHERFAIMFFLSILFKERGYQIRQVNPVLFNTCGHNLAS